MKSAFVRKLLLRKGRLWIFSLSLVLLASCSTQKNTRATRFFHSFTTRYNVYFNGESYREGTIHQLPDLLNNKLCAKIYNMGFETMRFPKGVVPPVTFYKDGNCPKVIQQILQAQNRDQLTSHGSNASPLKYLFEENGNTLIKADGMLSENALNGHSWLVEICHHVEKCMEKARKEYADKFSLPVVLASFIKPPYGMFTSMLNFAVIA